MTYLLTILIALTLGIDDPKPRIQQGFHVVEGQPSSKVEGVLLRVRKLTPSGYGPIQTLYLQHREPDTPLNTAKSKKADIVFYCYPETMKDRRFALEDAGGKVYSTYDRDMKLLTLFDDSKMR